MSTVKFVVVVLGLIALSLAASVATACTGICLTAKDGSIIRARTLEFGFPLDSQVLHLPVGAGFVGTTASGRPGLKWESKYAAVGLNCLGLNQLVDGVNEAGLSAGAFYFPGYAGYQQPGEELSRALAPWEVVTWILTRCRTVDEVRQGLTTIQVAGVSFNKELGVPPLHYVVQDAAGKSLVVEYVGGVLTSHENPIGVITNSPNFDWHITNLRNYLNLTSINSQAIEVKGLKLQPFGMGSGLLGMPGDFTPPSRFVRAVALSQLAIPAANAEDTVRDAFHILDSFDIPLGAVRAPAGSPEPPELTQWTIACDLTHRKIYFHTFDNRRVRVVDLAGFASSDKRPTVLNVPPGNGFESLEPPAGAAGQ